jgi:hypothetical protein
MNLVVIQVDALAWTIFDLQLFAGTVADDLERHARIDAAQDADRTALDAIPVGDFTSQVVFAQFAVVDVADFATEFLGQAKRSGLQSGGHLFAVFGEILEEDAFGPEIVLQPKGANQVREDGAERQAIKAAQNSGDKPRESR